MLENTFKTGLVKELKSRFPGCIVLHADPNEIHEDRNGRQAEGKSRQLCQPDE